MSKFINLTPHAITIVNADGSTLREIPPSGTVARVAATTVTVGELDGIPITATDYGQVEGLPEWQVGVYYVVSALVAKRALRPDLFIPNESVRDENGRIVGCRSLATIC